jgi:hypothetical protein
MVTVGSVSSDAVVFAPPFWPAVAARREVELQLLFQHLWPVLDDRQSPPLLPLAQWLSHSGFCSVGARRLASAGVSLRRHGAAGSVPPGRTKWV